MNVLNTIKSREGGLLRDIELPKKNYIRATEEAFLWCHVSTMFTTLANMLCIALASRSNLVCFLRPQTTVGLQNYRESLAEVSFVFPLTAWGVTTNQSTTGAEKCISVQTLLITFLEHPAKVKAAMNEPETRTKKTQQRQS